MKINIHKKWLKSLLALSVILITGSLVLTGCGKNSSSSASKTKEVSVGVVGSTDNPIWNQVNKNLKDKNIHVKTVNFTDGLLANRALSEGQLDLNAFQHYAFLNQDSEQKHYKFSVVDQSYITPLNMYSAKIKNVNQIKDGDKIAIPNNVTNAGRALKVLESAGLIKTNPEKGNFPSVNDITENKKHLNIIQTDPAAIMKLLPNFSAAITNSTYVQAIHKDPIKDSIYHIDPNINDSRNKPWINVIVSRDKDKNNSTIKEVVKAYNSKSVADLLNKQYKNVQIPAFKY